MKVLLYHMTAAALAALLLLCTGCGVQKEPAQSAAETPAVEAPAPEAAEKSGGEDTSRVADASQMTTVEDVTEDGLVPVGADELVDGTYRAAVDCSSSMFRVEDCVLTVADGAMTATLTMSSASYGYLFPGTAEDAAAADRDAYIPAAENAEGKSVFTLPVEALDAGTACAAWSRNKKLWYDRTLVFRSDSLPLTAFRTLVTAETLGLADGTYEAEVTLSGGSGRANVQSPTLLTVENGTVRAGLVWSSANYDYMIVDGERFDAQIAGGHSLFEIPVAAFDRPLAVIADTTAMSQPYEIEYTLTFHSASLRSAS